MIEDLIKRSDAIKSLDNAWINGTSLLDANETIKQLNAIPSADRPQKVIAQITFNEEKLCEIVKEAVERFKEEYEVIDRPQGKWIYCEDDEGQDGYKCSECGFFVPWHYGYEDINYIYKYHACPSCFARMI